MVGGGGGWAVGTSTASHPRLFRTVLGFLYILVQLAVQKNIYYRVHEEYTPIFYICDIYIYKCIYMYI